MTAVLLPQLSLGMEEGRLVAWLVADGAAVAAGQAIAEIETDKATAELEAPSAGVLRHVAEEGAIVRVEAAVAEIHGSAGQDAGIAAAAPAAALPPAVTPVDGSLSAGGERTLASPAARRLAREHGIDVAAVTGSGPQGRVITRDVEAAVAAEREPQQRRSLREIVVRGLTASWREVPHIHVAGELDATPLAEARALCDATTSAITVTDLLLAAFACALSEVPELAPHAAAQGRSANLGLAVATGDGVVAPVVRDVRGLPLPALAAERARLVAAARDGTLSSRDLGSADATLSNLGAFPVDFFAPIVPLPEALVLATGRVADHVVAIDGMIAVRPRIWASAAIDHRVADGVAGGRLLAALERSFSLLPALAQTESA